MSDLDGESGLAYFPEDEEKNPTSFVARLLQRLGEEEGIEVLVEPDWRHVGRIRRVDGTFTYFRGTNFDLNGMGSMATAVDKAYAAFFLRECGYNVIPGKTFFSPSFAKSLKSADSFDAAYEYARGLGFPVVVKPNSLTRGIGVCTAYNKRTFMQVVRKVSRLDHVFLVQPLVSGHDYRVVVLDGDVISAYERLPLTVVGDGILTIDELLDMKQQDFIARGRDTAIKKDDFRIDVRLKRHHMGRATVLAEGESFALLDNRNLSTGGDSIDVTGKVDPSYEDLACRITRDMGLRYCGVDLMVREDITKPVDPVANGYHVIEINSAPGVDHYAQSGDKQKLVVAEMYRKILRTLAGVV